jgi:MtN3 and saliva related transmembrane protein
MIADILCGISGIIFIIALIPQIIRNFRRKSATDISLAYLCLYIIGIICLGFGYALMGAPIAFFTNIVAFAGYLILLVQKLKYK